MRTKGLLAVMILLNLFCISFIFKIFPYLGVLFFKLLTLCIGEGEVVKFSIFLCFTAISRGHGNGDYIKNHDCINICRRSVNWHSKHLHISNESMCR